MLSMDDPKEAELARLRGASQRRVMLIRELAKEHDGELGYQERLAKISGLTKQRISQIVRQNNHEA